MINCESAMEDLNSFGEAGNQEGNIQVAPSPLEGEPSELQEFYRNSTVLLTGATGFLGKLIVEKLVRVCDVKEICCVVRSKRGQNNEERFESIFKHACFDKLKATKTDYTAKISLIPGDCSLPNLGISDKDRSALIEKVNVIIHCAATVRFVEDLKTAFYINCRAPKDLLAMCREMPRIKAMVHVSTAYSNCPKSDIREAFYDLKVPPKTILSMIENMDEKMVKKITPILLDEWPNTYVFTKAVAENIIKTEGKGLPVSIVRPSIILNTAREPFPGWIDNFFGPVGFTLGVAMGFLRCILIHKEKLTDMVPADYVINNCLAVAWDVSQNKEKAKNTEQVNEQEEEIPIYNFTSSSQNPITWEKSIHLADSALRTVPSTKPLWHAWYFMTRDKYTQYILSILFHFLPALFVDTLLKCIGRKPILFKMYSKLNKFSHVITYFSTREWKFHNDNVQNLWKKLSARDQSLFCFDMSTIVWEDFLKSCSYGGRVYLIKDPLSTVPEGRIKYRKMYAINFIVCTFLSLLFLRFLYGVFCFVF